MLKTLTQTLTPHKEAKQKPVILFGFDDAENERSLEIGENLVNPEPASTNLSAEGQIIFKETVPYTINPDSVSVPEGPVDSESFNLHFKETGGAIGDKAIKVVNNIPGVANLFKDSMGELLGQDIIGHYKESQKPKKAEGDSSKPETEESVKKEIVFAQQQEQVQQTSTKIEEITQERFIKDVCRVGGDEAATMTNEQKNTRLGKQANFKTPDNIHDLVELRRIMKGEEKVVEKIEEAQDAKEITPKGSYLNQNLNHEGAGAGSSTKAA